MNWKPEAKTTKEGLIIMSNRRTVHDVDTIIPPPRWSIGDSVRSFYRGGEPTSIAVIQGERVFLADSSSGLVNKLKAFTKKEGSK